MATPTSLTADMLRDMAKLVEDYQPRQYLLASAGFRRELAKHAEFAAPRQSHNPLFEGYALSYGGISTEPIDIPPEKVIDWSGCRSPSRAKRRHARGIPQRIKVELRERAYLIDRNKLTALARDLDARMIAAVLGKPE